MNTHIIIENFTYIKKNNAINHIKKLVVYFLNYMCRHFSKLSKIIKIYKFDYSNEVYKLVEIPINFNNGNCTITNNSSGQLTFATADAAKGVIIPSRNMKVSSSTDGNVTSGDVVNFGSGTVVAGVCYYFTSAGAWANTDQRAVASSIGFLGVAMGSGTASTVGMCIRGMVTMSTDVGTIGGVVYLDRNGNFTNAPSTSSGDTNRIMGYCLDNSDGQIFFNPSQDWVTLA
jgi:hypothetical protein